MVSPRSEPKPALHLNTNIERLRPGSVHFDAPLRPRASTRGSPPETIDSPPFLSPPDYASSESDSESECWMRGRPSGNTLDDRLHETPTVGFWKSDANASVHHE
ncbi:MAG: hypothetical protein Q9171_006616 [Xanthocarpia ochracea]